jgi:hypothetical protein
MLRVPPQDPPDKTSAKGSFTLTGTVAEKGALLLSTAGQKMYRVWNSGMLKPLDGQLVTLKAGVLPEKRQLYVTAVRLESLDRQPAFSA